MKFNVTVYKNALELFSSYKRAIRKSDSSESSLQRSEKIPYEDGIP